MAAEAPLPLLREDLGLHPGPADNKGAPSWTLHDPVRGRFFRIDWPAFEVLARWHCGTAEAIARAVNSETTLSLGPEDVIGIGAFLVANELNTTMSEAGTQRLLLHASARRQSWTKWLLHHYLFFRVPLVRPDAFLGRTCHWFGWVGSRAFCMATLLALLAGLFFAYRQWDVFSATFVHTLRWSALPSYIVALAGVKAVHEAAHAYTAKRLGCRVPTMGVAFIVLWPLLYTDVNEAWKLKQRGQRLWVDAAGIVAELTVAAWATLAWAFLPDGPVRQAAFVLSAVTWISSLITNLSPFMRFDGYFLLMDMLDMPNLHQRAFAIGRWWLREALFGLGEPQPEPASRRAVVLLTVFAAATWIYRLLLFFGIALLVYHFFIKVVGLVLFSVEIVWFIAMPIWLELKAWHERRRSIARSGRTGLSLLMLGAGLVLLTVPWRGQISAPGVLQAARIGEVFVPFAARIEEIRVHEGEQVATGQLLFEFSAPSLQYRMAQIEARLQRLGYELQMAGIDPGQRAQANVIREQLAAARAEAQALDAETRRLRVTAPQAGVAANILPGLAKGSWISQRERLAVIRGQDTVLVRAYVSEEDIARLALGQIARFFADAPGRPVLKGRVAAIGQTALQAIAEPLVTAASGGGVESRPVNGAAVPQRSLYQVDITLEDAPEPGHKLRGRVVIDGQRQSLAARFVRSAAIVFVREMGT